MKFVEKTHKYTDEDGDYTPVTSFIKSFRQPVDWDKALIASAKKKKISPEELKKQWDEARDKGAAKGTKYHKKMEDLVANAGIIPIDGKNCKVVFYETKEGIKEDEKVVLEDNSIYSEKMIWSKRYKICGTADLVEVVDGFINIKDYKTNAKLEKVAYVHPTKGAKKLLPPLSHLEDTDFNIYQIQVNVYMYMLLQHNRNLKMGKMEILHIKFDEEDNDLEPEVHEVSNLQTEARMMFEAFKNRHK